MRKKWILSFICLLAFIFCGCTDIDSKVFDDTETESVFVYTYPELETYSEYEFRNNKLLQSHYEKHGIEMGYESAEDYENAASAVINNPEALHKIEAEDGDDVYYLEDTNEFVIVSTDGYIRTYFYPDNGITYFESQ